MLVKISKQAYELLPLLVYFFDEKSDNWQQVTGIKISPVKFM